MNPSQKYTLAVIKTVFTHAILLSFLLGFLITYSLITKNSISNLLLRLNNLIFYFNNLILFLFILMLYLYHARKEENII